LSDARTTNDRFLPGEENDSLSFVVITVLVINVQYVIFLPTRNILIICKLYQIERCNLLFSILSLIFSHEEYRLTMKYHLNRLSWDRRKYCYSFTNFNYSFVPFDRKCSINNTLISPVGHFLLFYAHQNFDKYMLYDCLCYKYLTHSNHISSIFFFDTINTYNCCLRFYRM
jgi:hypothetical protein